MKIEYIVICQQIVGNPEFGYRTVYNWDQERFPTAQLATNHGFLIRESDDFNIASLDGELLIGFYWMDRQFEEGQFDRAEIEDQLGLTVSQ